MYFVVKNCVDVSFLLHASTTVKRDRESLHDSLLIESRESQLHWESDYD